MKLLHVSDIHFGIKFLNRDPKVRKTLINESYRTFDRVVDYVLNNDVKAILIAGDLFDGEYRSLRAEKYLIDAFKTLNNYDVKVFYSLGNHDSNTTFKNGFLKILSDNVIIFNKEKPKSYLLDNKVYIHSCGHMSNIENRNLTEKFPDAIEGYYNIGLLHCSIVSNVKEHHLYLPTKIEDLRNKKYDYWGLGHIHKREKVSENIFYSGSLFGLNSKENGDKGGLLVDLKKNNVVVDFIDFSTVNYETVTINLQEEAINNQYDLLKTIDNRIALYEKKIMMKLVLNGQTSLYSFFNKEIKRKEIMNEIKRNEMLIDVSLDTSGIKPLLDYREYIRDENILGYIVKGLEDDDYISEIQENYNVDPTDETFVKELMNKMVGVSYED